METLKIQKSWQINILKNRHIPNPSHIERKPIHRPKSPRNRHHIIHNIIIRLRLRQRDRSRINETIVARPATSIDAQIGIAPCFRESVQDSLAVVQTHVGQVPVFFFSYAAEDVAECFDVGEA